MERARPTHRPIVLASLGSLSGPSTTSAMPKITRISENSMPNITRRQPPGVAARQITCRRDSGVWCSLLRLRLLLGDRHFGELRILGGWSLDLLVGFTLGLAVVHGLLEATKGRTQVRAQCL